MFNVQRAIKKSIDSDYKTQAHELDDSFITSQIIPLTKA